VHTRTPDAFPESGLDENYCRNPDGESAPWCYTTDPDVVWEYCNVCSGEQGSNIDEHAYLNNEQAPTRSQSSSLLSSCHLQCGRALDSCSCQPTCVEAGNCCEDYSQFCGSAELKDQPLSFDTSCFGDPNGISYRGALNVTVSGRLCQSWDSQYPHVHSRTADLFPNAVLQDNYCRNPDNERYPWCYTVDPNVVWEYCDVCGAGAAALDLKPVFRVQRDVAQSTSSSG